MKKIIALLLVTALMMFTLVGCGDKDRLNYVKGLKDYVELCDIENITVDLNSADYLEVYNSAMSEDLTTYTYTVEGGTVAEGDIANIDFAGKVNGVAFTGGTAEGYDLTIGSGQFIDGFEDQLIGVKIGDTVDIKVTLPANYGDSTDLETGSKTITLSGADAVFTVTVNAVKRTYSEINDEFASAAGFDSVEAYNKDLQDRCVKNYLCDYIINNSTVKELPSDKDGNCYSYHKGYYTDYAEYYGYTFETFLSSYGIDEATFKKDILTQEIIMYACFDALGLEVTDEAMNAKIEEVAVANNMTVEEVKKDNGENYIEYMYVNSQVVDVLYEKANIVE